MYRINLTDAEMRTLAWAAAHGYFPEEAYDEMHLADDAFDPDDPDEVPMHMERPWVIPEAAAWSIPTLREEDPDACFACIGGDLLEKLVDLEEKIV